MRLVRFRLSNKKVLEKSTSKEIKQANKYNNIIYQSVRPPSDSAILIQ